jgi:flagellar protein FliS
MTMSALRAIRSYQVVSAESASPARLLDDLLARLLADCASARAAMAARDIPGRGQAIGHALAIVAELLAALDHAAAPELAANLASLWDFVAARLTTANVATDVAAVADAERVVGTLRHAFAQGTEQAR